jgi:hypothetical protein
MISLFFSIGRGFGDETGWLMGDLCRVTGTGMIGVLSGSTGMVDFCVGTGTVVDFWTVTGTGRVDLIGVLPDVTGGGIVVDFCTGCGTGALDLTGVTGTVVDFCTAPGTVDLIVLTDVTGNVVPVNLTGSRDLTIGTTTFSIGLVGNGFVDTTWVGCVLERDEDIVGAVKDFLGSTSFFTVVVLICINLI